MEQLHTGQYLYSSTDLVAFLECNHTSYLSVKSLSEEIPQSTPSNLAQILRKKGLKHETDYLQSLKAQHQTVSEIPTTGGLSKRAELTAKAMRSGTDIIYQGVVYEPPWQGIADFLIKCDKPSSLGNYSYEVLETKLSKTARAKHLMQLCVYSEFVGRTQGVRPVNTYLLLGNGEKAHFKLNDFFFYYSHTKKCFENHIARISEVESYPEPCRHCAFCEWQTHCKTQWEKDKHLSLVANIQRKQIEKLRENSIRTINELAASSPDTEVPDLSKNVFLRLRSQARLQNYKAKTGEDRYEIIEPAKNGGFAFMPPPDQADLFFDIESDSFHPDDLAYLFGVYRIENGKAVFETFWGHNLEQEKESFERLVDFLNTYLTEHPNAHIYHYGQCDTVTLKRLSHRHATHEAQLEQLIRAQKFIDLYEIVHKSIYISEPGYSLKNLEKFYMEQRTDTITQALDSVAVYNEWRENQDQTLLQQIADYNKSDCRSAYLLREWLVRIRPKGIPWHKKTPIVARHADWQLEYQSYKDQLELQQQKSPQLYQRLTHLLEFHNREAKPKQLITSDNTDCLVELRRIDKLETENHEQVYSYSFPSQECTLKVGQKIQDIDTIEMVGQISKLDKTQCVIEITAAQNQKPLPKQLSIGAINPIDSSIIRSAIYRYADHLIKTPEIAHVATELLANNRPRIKGTTLSETIKTSDNLYDAILKSVAGLNHSYLFIQGPPGSGKTYLCSRIVVDLIKRGKKVGISSNSHQAIHHLLKQIEAVALSENVHFDGIKKASISSDNSFYNGEFIRNITSLAEIDLDADLFAGTAWAFSSSYFDEQLDYLFIDEAGQVSTANMIAMSNATKNIVLIGDQMQLSQPMQGIHPQEAGLSILELLLGDDMVISADCGVFLSRTYRLKPSICKFISDAFYEGRLIPQKSTNARKLHLQDTNLPDEGIVIIDTHHEKCSTQSSEEARIIKALYQKLLGRNFTEKDNSTRRITADDILIVTPYNSQVDYLYTLLPENARIGTVDKFQGQEAPIVLISMVSSCIGHFSQKLIEFLYSRNRLNVALSRAQCLAIVAASPKLMEVACTTVKQMKLVNTYCQLNEYAQKMSSAI